MKENFLIILTIILFLYLYLNSFLWIAPTFGLFTTGSGRAGKLTISQLKNSINSSTSWDGGEAHFLRLLYDAESELGGQAALLCLFGHVAVTTFNDGPVNWNEYNDFYGDFQNERTMISWKEFKAWTRTDYCYSCYLLLFCIAKKKI